MSPDHALCQRRFHRQSRHETWEWSRFRPRTMRCGGRSLSGRCQRAHHVSMIGFAVEL
jgi:hypothetical protein